MNRSLAFGTILLLACSFSAAAKADDYTVQILYKGKTQWENYSRYFDAYDSAGNLVRPTAKENAENDARRLLNSDDESIDKVRIVRTGKGARERTDAEPNTSSSKPPIHIPAKSNGAKGTDADGGGKNPIIVKVFKEVDGNWVEQTDLRMVSRDYQTASAYFQKAKALRGYTATWNAPGYPNPLVSTPELGKVDIGPYKKPVEKVVQRNPDRYVGVWYFARPDGSSGPSYFLLNSDGTARSTKDYRGEISQSGSWRESGENEISVDLAYLDPELARAYPSKTLVITITSDGEGFNKTYPQFKYNFRKTVGPRD